MNSNTKSEAIPTAVFTSKVNPASIRKSYYNHEPSRADGKDLECGDLSPLWSPGRLVGQAEPRPAVRETNGMLLAGDGDKSPAKSGDKSLHSISLNRD
jgi:hypothetical protein